MSRRICIGGSAHWCGGGRCYRLRACHEAAPHLWEGVPTLRFPEIWASLTYGLMDEATGGYAPLPSLVWSLWPSSGKEKLR